MKKVISDKQSLMCRNGDLEETRYLNMAKQAWEIKTQNG